ncbi:MAG TPA: hypothetical protein VIF57_30275 [Polyangia bacterium]|jgi:hypothetical protein
MKARQICLVSWAVVFLAAVGCTPSDSGGTPGAGGSAPGGSSATGAAGSSGGGTTGSGGSGARGGSTSGTGNSQAGTGGASSGAGGSSATGSGGSAGASSGGSGGAAAGTGGSATGVAGRGGTTGAAGARGGSGGAGGTTGTGGTTGAAGAGAGDSYVSGVTVAVSTKVNTILIVTWTQAKAADQTFLEFSFAGSPVMTSRMVAGATGAHRDVVLGVPGSTAVTLRIVSRVAGTDYKTKDYMGTTGAVPSGMPKPTVSTYDATKATPERYLLGAVENSPNTCVDDSCYFYSTWWLYILDRQGRVVWYYADGTSNDVSSFPQKARDGEYLFVEKRAFSTTGTPSVLKMTLDRETYNTSVQVPYLSDGVDMTSDGSLLYDTEERMRPNSELRQMTRAGTVTTIWKCPTTGFNNCYSNVVSWDPATDTVLLSFPEANRIAQIDRKTGTLVATYGSSTGDYTFSPSPWNFVWQHFSNISPSGTLLVSSHLPQYTKDSAAGPNQHAFEEFMIDRTNKRLVRTWIYGDSTTDGPEWAASRGMALRLSNGNTLVNYGTGGVIREVTPDKKTVFYVKFDLTSSNDYFNKLVGHNFFIDDLYSLNGGGPQ